MSTSFRVVLSDHLLPVQAFFNVIPDREFVGVLEAFSRGVGAGFNDVFCEFPGQDGSSDEVEGGVEFAIKEEVIVVGYDVFVSVLGQACDAFLKNNPLLREEVEGLLKEVKDRVAGFPQ